MPFDIFLDAMRGNAEHCVEKSELQALLLAQLTASEPEPAPQVAPPGPASADAAVGEGGSDEMADQEVD